MSRFLITLIIFPSFSLAQEKPYLLLGPRLEFYESHTPGQFGGYWRGKDKIYGKLNCASALMWIKKGHYTNYRVFFATEADAISAGFRPCKKCMKEKK
ncbi:MAG: Ada metal-binding domain-containing protein [Bacteriovoracia bacterium]